VAETSVFTAAGAECGNLKELQNFIAKNVYQYTINGYPGSTLKMLTLDPDLVLIGSTRRILIAT
jgi:hypothetical protein